MAYYIFVFGCDNTLGSYPLHSGCTPLELIADRPRRSRIPQVGLEPPPFRSLASQPRGIAPWRSIYNLFVGVGLLLGFSACLTRTLVVEAQSSSVPARTAKRALPSRANPGIRFE